jgi:hypothetical protein
VVHAVLERVLRVKLDLDALYAAEAASAQKMLEQRLVECPDHEFAVRFSHSALLLHPRPLAARSKAMIPKGPNPNVWRLPETNNSRNHRV